MNYTRWFSHLVVAALVMGPSCRVAAQDASPVDPYPDGADVPAAPAPAPSPTGPPELDSESGDAAAPPAVAAPSTPDGYEGADGDDAADGDDGGEGPPLNGDAAARPVAPDVPEAPPAPRVPPVPVTPPNLFAGPTGRMVPGAVFFNSTSIDTAGGVRSDLRVGLGDVAEFGIATDDRVRVRSRNGVVRATDGTVEDTGTVSDAEAIQPYFVALFKLGVAESRLFSAQPALAIEFRKSFEEEEARRDTRTASLTLTASKTFFDGDLTAHVGVGLWDAEVDREVFVSEGPDGTRNSAGREVLSLHDEGAGKNVRPYGGLELRALDNATIVVDLYWSPEFTFGDRTDSDLDEIELRPLLAWGTRYEVGSRVWLEAGVRVPDIGEANLLNAQIFGQLSVTYRGLRTLLARN